MNVGELKQLLADADYADDMEIITYGPDVGGYDGTYTRELVVEPAGKILQGDDALIWPYFVKCLYIGGRI